MKYCIRIPFSHKHNCVLGAVMRELAFSTRQGNRQRRANRAIRPYVRLRRQGGKMKMEDLMRACGFVQVGQPVRLLPKHFRGKAINRRNMRRWMQPDQRAVLERCRKRYWGRVFGLFSIAGIDPPPDYGVWYHCEALHSIRVPAKERKNGARSCITGLTLYRLRR